VKNCFASTITYACNTLFDNHEQLNKTKVKHINVVDLIYLCSSGLGLCF